MKKALWTIFVLLIVTTGYPQKKFDSKIIVTTTDTVDLYHKVRTYMITNNFIVKDLDGSKRITTYPRGIGTFPGFAIVNIEFRENIITLYGYYGLNMTDGFGYNYAPKDYQSIIYYKSSKTWRILMEIANSIGGQITYSK